MYIQPCIHHIYTTYTPYIHLIPSKQPINTSLDYDEFLTGARSEATYMMFKSFLPKVRTENREQRTEAGRRCAVYNARCRCVICVVVWVRG